jgi:hypothetical protein
MENGSAEVVMPHIYHSHFKHTFADAHEHTPIVPVGREPTPKEFVPNLKVAQLCIGEVLFDSFLEEHYVYLVFTEVVF